MSTREPAVEGQFYPDKEIEVRYYIERFNQQLDETLPSNDPIRQLKPKAVIVPHAGYVYSGFTANVAHQLMGEQIFERVIVIGPSHRVGFTGTSIADNQTYYTPLGNLEIDRALVVLLKEKFGLHYIPEAHHEHSTEVQFPFIKAYLPDVKVVELVYGDETPEHLAEVVEMLLTLPSTGVVISTDLSHFYDSRKASALDRICIDAVKKLHRRRLHEGCEACGKIGVEAMIIAAKRLKLEPVVLDYRTSGEVSGDNSEVVGYMSAAFVTKQVMSKREVLLTLARAAIAEAVGLPSSVIMERVRSHYRWLDEKGACFVTLTTGNEHRLRGCIGSIVAHQSLYDDLMHNAKSAALHDPRFPSLTKEEFEQIKVEVSVLTAPKALIFDSVETLKSKIVPGKHGVILRDGSYQATFLPQVWDQLPTFEYFFEALCQKAGLSGDCLTRNPQIFTYEVEEYHED